nr:AraC family transcriptional regulator [Nitrosomonas nitrosa]
MFEPTVSAGLARSYLGFAVSRGASERALSDTAGIELDSLDDPDNRVPLGAYVKLVRAGKAMTGEPGLPLIFAEAIDLSEYSVVGMLSNAAETMMDSATQLNRYGQLVVEVDIGEGPRFSYEPRDGVMWMIDQRRNPNDFFELTETTFTRLITGPRRFLPRAHVLEVHVTHPEPPHRAVYDSIWRCPISFNAPWNAMRMDHTLATHRVRLEPQYVFGVLSKHAEQLLKDLESSKTTRGRVETLLMPILHTGDIGMDVIAAKIGQSRQTLYRNLKEEGVTFEQVLDDLRHKLALHYLDGKRVSVNETAYLVGFSDPSAFSRAFKRWTGRSPGRR